jgi:hypothetical protein
MAPKTDKLNRRIDHQSRNALCIGSVR